MTELNFNRIKCEFTHRLRGTLNAPEAEQVLCERCVNAIALRSIDYAELFKEITLDAPNSQVRIIQSNWIVNVLKNTGTLDLVCICINAQNTKEGHE